MAMEPALIQSFAQLQEKHLALQRDYHALQARLDAQETSAIHWLEQRNCELQAEALAQNAAQKLQIVFHQIAEHATAGLSFYDFLQALHGLLGELIDAKNCYVCLCLLYTSDAADE